MPAIAVLVQPDVIADGAQRGRRGSLLGEAEIDGEAGIAVRRGAIFLHRRIAEAGPARTADRSARLALVGLPGRCGARRQREHRAPHCGRRNVHTVVIVIDCRWGARSPRLGGRIELCGCNRAARSLVDLYLILTGGETREQIASAGIGLGGRDHGAVGGEQAHGDAGYTRFAGLVDAVGGDAAARAVIAPDQIADRHRVKAEIDAQVRVIVRRRVVQPIGFAARSIPPRRGVAVDFVDRLHRRAAQSHHAARDTTGRNGADRSGEPRAVIVAILVGVAIDRARARR